MLEALLLLQDWNACTGHRASFCSVASRVQKKLVPSPKSFQSSQADSSQNSGAFVISKETREWKVFLITTSHHDGSGSPCRSTLKGEGASPSAESVFTGHRGKHLSIAEDTLFFLKRVCCAGVERIRAPFTAWEILQRAPPDDSLGELTTPCFGIEGHVSLASLSEYYLAIAWLIYLQGITSWWFKWAFCDKA